MENLSWIIFLIHAIASTFIISEINTEGEDKDNDS